MGGGMVESTRTSLRSGVPINVGSATERDAVEDYVETTMIIRRHCRCSSVLCRTASRATNARMLHELRPALSSSETATSHIARLRISSDLRTRSSGSHSDDTSSPTYSKKVVSCPAAAALGSETSVELALTPRLGGNWLKLLTLESRRYVTSDTFCEDGRGPPRHAWMQRRAKVSFLTLTRLRAHFCCPKMALAAHRPSLHSPPRLSSACHPTACESCCCSSLRLPLPHAPRHCRCGGRSGPVAAARICREGGACAATNEHFFFFVWGVVMAWVSYAGLRISSCLVCARPTRGVVDVCLRGPTRQA